MIAMVALAFSFAALCVSLLAFALIMWGRE